MENFRIMVINNEQNSFQNSSGATKYRIVGQIPQNLSD